MQVVYIATTMVLKITVSLVVSTNTSEEIFTLLKSF
jgi:hypothetical protein